MKEWFPHDYYSTKDLAIVRLLMKHGATGYGVFWATIEILHSNNVVYATELLDVLCHMFGQSDTNPIESVLQDMISFGLLHQREDGTMYSRRVEANKEARDAITESKRAAAQVRWSNTKQKESRSNASAIVKHNITEQNSTLKSTNTMYELPCTGNRVFAVGEGDISTMQELYPSVDIFGELRKMKGWLLANSMKRKTPRGMPRFIHNWLSKQQDNYNGHNKQQSNKIGERASNYSTSEYDAKINSIANAAMDSREVHTANTPTLALREAGTTD